MSIRYGDTTIENPFAESFPETNPEFQKHLRDDLQARGMVALVETPHSRFFGSKGLENAFCFVESNLNTWPNFCTRHLPELKAQGWDVVIEDSFYFRSVTPDRWYGAVSAIDKTGTEWIAFDYGFEFDNQKVSIIPLLAEQLKTRSSTVDPNALIEGDPSLTSP